MMNQVVIENPILNSPYVEPQRHFKFSDEGITNEIGESRRVSSYFMPIPAEKKKGKQLAFDTEWTHDGVEENKFINRVRARVGQWRQGGYVSVTKTTGRLLEYWTRPDRERKLFFCLKTGGVRPLARARADTRAGSRRPKHGSSRSSTAPPGEARDEGDLNLIIEVTGEKKKDKEAKAATASALWVPAVNNHGGFGRWAFAEIRDPWNTQTVTREILTAVRAGRRNGGQEATA